MPVFAKVINTTSTSGHLVTIPDATDTTPGVVTLNQIRQIDGAMVFKERQAVLQADGFRITHVWAVPFADANYFPLVQVFNTIGGISANIDPDSVTPTQCDVLLSAPMDGELIFVAYPSS